MKRKLLFLMTLVITAFTYNAKAQTDVTSTYLQNADFSQSTPIASNLKGYGKDGSPYGFQDVDEWSFTVVSADNSNASYPNSGMGGAVFAYGSSYQLQGNNKSAPATNPDGVASGNCLGFFGVWGCGGYYYQEVTFPAGDYTINIPVYNQSGTNGTTTYFGFYPTSGTNQTMATPTSTGSWVTLTKTFTLSSETTGQIRIGYKSNGSGSGANPHLFIDKVQILYTAKVVKDVLANALTAANNANVSLNNSDLAAAITTAQAVYDNASATQDEVNAAAETLNNAVMLAMSAAGDVTFLLSNPGFENCTETTTNVAAVGNASPLDISGEWTQTSSAGWSSSAVVVYGGSGQVNGVSAPSADNAGNGGKTLGVSVGWGGLITYKSKSVTLPAGSYTMTVHAYNNLENVTQFASKNGFVSTNGTSYLSTKNSFAYGEWVEDVITFTLNEATEGAIQIGGQAVSGGSGSNAKVFFDNIKIEYQSFLAAAQAAWQEAHDAAVVATNNGDYDNVNGKERADLNAEINKTEPTTLEGYEAATQALIDAINAFIAAKKNYDDLALEIDKATALGTDATTATTTLNDPNTTSADALAATQSLKVDEYNYVTTNYQFSVELGEWQSTGENTKAAKFNNEHWSGETREYLNQDDSNGQGWNANSWSLSVYQDVELPAGNYVFKAAGRVASGDGTTVTLEVKNGETVLGSVNDFPHNGSEARGITTDGATQFADGYTYAKEGKGFGWEWRYVKFSLSETSTVSVAINAVATKSHEWFSIGDYTIITDNEANIALIAYNVALANAQTEIASEDYNNVAGVERANLQNAIDADNTLDKTDKDAIEAATQALNSATNAFTEAKDEYNSLATALTTASGIITNHVNVGDGPFQIPFSALDALNTSYNAAVEVKNGETTIAETAALEANTLTTAVDNYNNAELNAPAAGQVFNIINVSEGYNHTGKAVTFKSSVEADLSSNSTSMGYNELPGSFYPQDITFTSVEDVPNGYTLSYTRADGNTIYVGTGSSTGLGNNDNQLRPTTDATKAVTIKIVVTDKEGVWNLYNVFASCNIGANGANDQGFFTVDNFTSFNIQEAEKHNVPLTILDANKYGTITLPFDVAVPDGVVAYSTTELDGNVIVLTEVTEMKANTPYILFAEAGAETTLSGYGAAYTNTSYTSGLLTGAYVATRVPTGSYVLQNLNDHVAFYKVTEEAPIDMPAYRAYLTAPEASGVKTLNFGPVDDATGISAIEALTTGTAEIYNAAGVRVNKLEKGVNIIRTADGKTQKVLVK